MFQYHPLNPFRPPNWRWERARIMRENKIRGGYKRTEDALMLDAYKFQSGLSRCKDDLDRYELMEEYPDIYGAYLMYSRGENEDKHPMRFAVEARILAGQTYADIASRFGVAAKLIETYEQAFFNVIEKLENQDYIMTCVLGPSINAGMTDRDYDLLWKLFGYIYGPVTLDTFIHMTSKRFRPGNINEVDAALAEDTRASIQRKVAIVARTYAVNPFSQSELLNIYARLLEMEKDSGGERNRDVILQNVQVMLDKLPFRAGNEDVNQNNVLNEYDVGGVELNTQELMQAAAGNKSLADSEIASLKFPEPIKNVKPTKQRI